MSQIIIKKPVSILNKDIKINLKDFWFSASKSALGTTAQLALGNPMAGVTASKGVIDIAKLANLHKTVAETAWILVIQAVTRAINATLEEYKDLFVAEIDDDNLDTIAQEVETAINSVEVVLESDFFDHAKELDFIQQLKPILVHWLQNLHLDKHQASGFFNQFNNNVVIAFHEEWSENSDKYSPILDSLTSPFLQATTAERQLAKYRLWLQQEVNKRMFEESFGLSDIYIPLKAYYECDRPTSTNNESAISDTAELQVSTDLSQQQNSTIKKACHIHDEIENWLMTYSETDTLKVISGGPGSGKSSFAKMLASQWAIESKPVLFIPLHRLKLERYLLMAIEEYIKVSKKANYLSASILQQPKLLIIFDGLDELTMQGGDNVKETAKDFVDEVKNLLRDNKDSQWKAIITGREIAIQTQKNQFKQDKNIYHLLPYFLDEDYQEYFEDEDNLLAHDQRNDWWKKLAELKGLDFSKLPDVLATEHLQPVTQEPLLNYLVSLSYLNQNINFNENTNLNQIYADLLASVHERKYANSRKYQSTDEIDKSDFERILQEVALAVWHNNGRTATLKQITEQCESAHLTANFDIFKQDAQSGVIKLLMAFYFREFDGQQSDKTFEFTHKSFGEYLTARRIIREIADILEEYEFNCKKRGEPTALMNAFESWIKLFGKQEFDYHIGTFVEGELKIIAKKADGLQLIEKYQTLMIDLINLAIDNKSPVKNLHLASFEDDLLYRENSESSMLQIHSYCGKLTNKRVKQIASSSKYGISRWLNNIIQRNAYTPLNHLSFGDKEIFEGRFSNSNFKSSDYSKISFLHSSLLGISFIDCICVDVRFLNVNFLFSSFIDCNSKNSNFEYSIIRNTRIINSNFSSARFENTMIITTLFQNVNFTNADFTDATIDQANIDKFENVTFKDTIVTGTLLANDPDAKKDEKGVVTLTKVFNPTNKEEK